MNLFHIDDYDNIIKVKLNYNKMNKNKEEIYKQIDLFAPCQCFNSPNTDPEDNLDIKI